LDAIPEPIEVIPTSIDGIPKPIEEIPEEFNEISEAIEQTSESIEESQSTTGDFPDVDQEDERELLAVVEVIDDTRASSQRIRGRKKKRKNILPMQGTAPETSVVQNDSSEEQSTRRDKPALVEKKSLRKTQPLNFVEKSNNNQPTDNSSLSTRSHKTIQPPISPEKSNNEPLTIVDNPVLVQKSPKKVQSAQTQVSRSSSILKKSHKKSNLIENSSSTSSPFKKNLRLLKELDLFSVSRSSARSLERRRTGLLRSSSVPTLRRSLTRNRSPRGKLGLKENPTVTNLGVKTKHSRLIVELNPSDVTSKNLLENEPSLLDKRMNTRSYNPMEEILPHCMSNSSDLPSNQNDSAQKYTVQKQPIVPVGRNVPRTGLSRRSDSLVTPIKLILSKRNSVPAEPVGPYMHSKGNVLDMTSKSGLAKIAVDASVKQSSDRRSSLTIKTLMPNKLDKQSLPAVSCRQGLLKKALNAQTAVTPVKINLNKGTSRPYDPSSKTTPLDQASTRNRSKDLNTPSKVNKDKTQSLSDGHSLPNKSSLPDKSSKSSMPDKTSKQSIFNRSGNSNLSNTSSRSSLPDKSIKSSVSDKSSMPILLKQAESPLKTVLPDKNDSHTRTRRPWKRNIPGKRSLMLRSRNLPDFRQGLVCRGMDANK